VNAHGPIGGAASGRDRPTVAATAGATVAPAAGSVNDKRYPQPDEDPPPPDEDPPPPDEDPPPKEAVVDPALAVIADPDGASSHHLAPNEFVP
jgi:hypothetical protein